MEWHAYVELQSAANAHWDYVQEAYGDTRIPDDWDEPTLAEMLFVRGRGAEDGGLVVVSPDYCSGGRTGHQLHCPNQSINSDDPPF